MMIQRTGIFAAMLLLCVPGVAQDQAPAMESPQKGKLYFYWGWNWDWYSRSNIHYTGDQYDFHLMDVAALDKPKKFSLGHTSIPV